jgi:hypothetical protein
MEIYSDMNVKTYTWRLECRLQTISRSSRIELRDLALLLSLVFFVTQDATYLAHHWTEFYS